MDNETAKCVKGRRYDTEHLRFVGWTEPNEGRNAFVYFDADGRYLGPDADGVEPLWSFPEDCAILN